MATITYNRYAAGHQPWQLGYDPTATVAKAIHPGHVVYFAQDADGTNFNISVVGGRLTSFAWMDYGAPDMMLMQGVTSLDPAAFLAALRSPSGAARKVVNLLLSGDDDITGSARGDLLTGGAGNDILRGGGGRDRIDGGAGNDTIDGGSGADRLAGGAGADVFRFAATDGPGDVILDFHPGEDRIDLSGTGVALAYGTNVTFDAATGSLRVDLDGAAGPELEIRLQGVAALAAADLILG
jgi:Ca2+-binding RTX toxin-like protein